MAEPRRLYLDTEFNGYRGKLISMALVDGQGHEFYEVLSPSYARIDPWVAQNVIPVLDSRGIQDRLTLPEFQQRLAGFLAELPPLSADGSTDIEIVADWPDDIKHFCDALITGPGFVIAYPTTLRFALVTLPDFNSATESKVPHNALEDARALCRYCTGGTMR